MKVSVIILAYNHEKYISQAIESALAQETEFPFEILISEDFSTDRTREIVGEYRERFPNRIRLFLSPHNLRSNEVAARAVDAAQGEYLAMLDGDDYWTDRSKLQQQVRFLDEHPDCSLCFHNVRRVYENSSHPDDLFNPPDQKVFTGIEDILRRVYIGGGSAMLRRNRMPDLRGWIMEASVGDWPVFVSLAQRGKIGYIPQVLSVYRIHSHGMWSGMLPEEKYALVFEFYDLVNRATQQRYGRVIAEAAGEWRRELIDLHLSRRDYRAARREGWKALAALPLPSHKARRELLYRIRLSYTVPLGRWLRKYSASQAGHAREGTTP